MPNKQVRARDYVDHDRKFHGISGHRLFDFSEALLNGCDQQGVKNSILALRRGPIHYDRNTTIVWEGDSVDYVCLVVAGVVRNCRTYQDGNRGIVAFYLPGEFFGWGGDLTHSLSAEAATDTLVLFLKRSALLAAAIRDGRIAKFLLTATANDLRRAQEHSLLMSRRAVCRVATFLIDLSMRMGNTNYIDLSMRKIDIADHLGLTKEHLSRTLTALEKSGAIARTSYRTLFLRDRVSLVRLTRQ